MAGIRAFDKDNHCVENQNVPRFVYTNKKNGPDTRENYDKEPVGA